MLRSSLIAGIILAPCRQVIAVDLQAHGRTADIETACAVRTASASPNIQCPARHCAGNHALQHLFVAALASTVTPFLETPMPGAR
jgi:hypothetical protein